MAQLEDGRIKYIRVKYEDGSLSDAIPIMVLPDNVDFEDGENLTQKLEKLANREFYSDESISIGRIDKDNIGIGSVAVGKNLVASGIGSQAYGIDCQATGDYSHAEGKENYATGDISHAAGEKNHANGIGSHVEGYANEAYGGSSFTGGAQNRNSGISALVFGTGIEAMTGADNALVTGKGTVATAPNSFVHGTYNLYDEEKKYAEIIGGGDETKRKNIYTLDWDGNLTIAGTVKAQGFSGMLDTDTHGNDFSSYIKEVTLNGNKIVATRGNEEKLEFEFTEVSDHHISTFSGVNEEEFFIDAHKATNVLTLSTDIDGQSYFTDEFAIGMGNLHFSANVNNNSLNDTLTIRILCLPKNESPDAKWDTAYVIKAGYYSGDTNVNLYCPYLKLNPDIGNNIYIQVEVTDIHGMNKLYIDKGDISFTIMGISAGEGQPIIPPAPKGTHDRIVSIRKQIVRRKAETFYAKCKITKKEVIE